MPDFSGFHYRILYRVFRALPARLTSNIGAGMGHLYAMHAHLNGHLWFKRAQRNMQELADVDARRARAMAFQLLRNIGRTKAEFAIIDRCRDRVRFIGLEHVEQLRKAALVVSAHLGNWEIAGAALVLAGRPITVLYDPPTNETLHRLARETRLRLLGLAPGSRLLSATHNGLRQMTRAARAGENILIYVDELKDGLVWSPPLGRTLPLAGNRVLAAKLALKHDMQVLPVHVRRRRGLGFDIVVGEPLEPPCLDGSAEDRVTMLADCIAQVTDDWVRANLEQWFWLPEYRSERQFDASANLKK